MRFMAAQTNWSSVLLDPRSNFTVFVPSEAGFRANAGGNGTGAALRGCDELQRQPGPVPLLPLLPQ